MNLLSKFAIFFLQPTEYSSYCCSVHLTQKVWNFQNSSSSSNRAHSEFSTVQKSALLVTTLSFSLLGSYYWLTRTNGITTLTYSQPWYLYLPGCMEQPPERFQTHIQWNPYWVSHMLPPCSVHTTLHRSGYGYFLDLAQLELPYPYLWAGVSVSDFVSTPY